jgi:hypothetical protein
MQSGDDLLQLLAEIEAMAMAAFPFQADEQHNPRLLLALGQIAGIANAAMRAATPRRPRPVQPDNGGNVMQDYRPSPHAVTQGEDAFGD